MRPSRIAIRSRKNSRYSGGYGKNCMTVSLGRRAMHLAAHRPAGGPDQLPARRPRTVLAVEPAVRPEPLEHAHGHRGPGEDQILLDEEPALSGGGGVDGGVAGRVTEEQIHLERELDQPLCVGW